jgi:DNA-binding NtrC family response regulator
MGTSVVAYHSASYQAALQRVAKFAKDDTAPILLQGESGTGKTMLARCIHALSPRSHGPFQHIVLSTLDDGVASSELFGHLAGAFTDARHMRTGHFASANRGTLVLETVGSQKWRYIVRMAEPWWSVRIPRSFDRLESRVGRGRGRAGNWPRRDWYVGGALHPL